MEQVKLRAASVSLDAGETWTDIKPLEYESWLQEPILATGGQGKCTNTVAVCDTFPDDTTE